MNYKSGDTIAAIATPAGSGGIGIVRISGPKATQIAKKISTENLFLDMPSLLGLRITLAKPSTTDITYFKAPNSFTGEDVIELKHMGDQRY